MYTTPGACRPSGVRLMQKLPVRPSHGGIESTRLVFKYSDIALKFSLCVFAEAGILLYINFFVYCITMIILVLALSSLTFEEATHNSYNLLIKTSFSTFSGVTIHQLLSTNHLRDPHVHNVVFV